MYPARHLTRLALLKGRLRGRIARGRVACAESATRALAPLAWIDRAVAFCRRLAPYAWAAALPLALLRRRLAPQRGVLAALLRWSPLAFSFIRRFRRARAE